MGEDNGWRRVDTRATNEAIVHGYSCATVSRSSMPLLSPLQLKHDSRRRQRALPYDLRQRRPEPCPPFSSPRFFDRPNWLDEADAQLASSPDAYDVPWRDAYSVAIDVPPSPPRPRMQLQVRTRRSPRTSKACDFNIHDIFSLSSRPSTPKRPTVPVNLDPIPLHRSSSRSMSTSSSESDNDSLFHDDTDSVF
ncbi:hypothetical protein SISSUDRAFT_1064461 [Sistotremastrum suecicum HHB10207 ss-3]|uniref:Uncharacterized protein n=1 Tax=Sistotremastrum suecicum HHB10207 ss-3 TaxID=1314776 RepID=A0A166AMK2_9AGAM|nr:hypothetical protein SISSUDRAFT_1064461 [Sistotremastrum suecicum HHB10207 ss-3]